MNSPFQRLHHICVVVADIDRAVEFYTSVGIGPWQDYPPLTQYTELDVPSRDGFLGLKYKYADVGGIQYQLVEPGDGDSPQQQFLDTHGEGVFHLGFVVDDLAEGTAAAAGLGVRPWMTGRRPDGSGFTYFDTRARAGVTIEIRQSPTS
ncbi:VOC family protein [Goodfellowiella coeruleoviolacea]|uniref:Catechol 2,3-dioxygenase n=1 Tax=Goodfellowiella coeruleoviolacea TaxID=334858 RepID=A0AAE3GGQ2_9PSEU|nr:VOC family protein [Goodfellowiella coeruleoviolacea]MCP2167067.1 Catechol 2,3-dioxygenase [Goodfellowiella coeruleoviolacea]